MLINVIIGVVHFFASVFLVVFILLHSGRGSGLSDMFGGAGAGGALAGGTVVERNLDRMTIVVALIFTFASVFLALRLQPASVPVPTTDSDTPVTAPGEAGTPTDSLPVDVNPATPGDIPSGDAPASVPAQTNPG
ncbi:MAG: preprotein translocase subunit SecG [Acidimicrobiia bacterium]|nr:preprotein translocase subunit SecG [Acidimicrobiia bacterium]